MDRKNPTSDDKVHSQLVKLGSLELDSLARYLVMRQVNSFQETVLLRKLCQNLKTFGSELIGGQVEHLGAVIIDQS